MKDIIFEGEHKKKRPRWGAKEEKIPVTMEVRPVASIPWVTSSAVEEAENPEGPFLPNIHIILISINQKKVTVCVYRTTVS